MNKYFFALLLIFLPALVFAQNNMKKKAYYFYGEQCPHCKVVDEYFQQKGFYEKYEITKIEVASSDNPFNQKLFLDFGKAFGSADWGGVPTVVFADRYLIGDKPIIENFEKEMDDSVEAGNLPDPEKIQKTENGEKSSSLNPTQNNQKNSIDSKKKNNYLPYFFMGIILAGVGALVYINRK